MRALTLLMLALTTEAAAQENEKVHSLLETESSAFDFRVKLQGFFGHYQFQTALSSTNLKEMGGRLDLSLGYRSRFFGIYFESEIGVADYHYQHYNLSPDDYEDNSKQLSGANWLSGYHFLPITEGLELEISLGVGEMHLFGDPYTRVGDFYCAFAMKAGLGVLISITPSISFNFGVAYALKILPHNEQKDSRIDYPLQYIEPLLGFSFLL